MRVKKTLDLKICICNGFIKFFLFLIKKYNGRLHLQISLIFAPTIFTSNAAAHAAILYILKHV